MRITEWELIAESDLLSLLRQTRLRGFGEPLVYERATLELRDSVSIEALAPAQRYVLQPGIDRILDLYASFLEHGVDIFHLRGGVRFWSDELAPEDQPVPLIPPVVEESVEPDGRRVWLINDGIHRVWAARAAQSTINIVLATGVPAEWPYYAYPLSDGWAGVQAIAELTQGFQKKEYRDPENYKALFRNFNAVLPGVQKQRERTNPEHLRAGV
jgi:hypothetical protein